MRHTHLLTILYADQQSINKVPKVWGQLNEKGNGGSPDPFLARLRRALRKRLCLTDRRRQFYCSLKRPNGKSRAHYFGTKTIFRKVLYIEKKKVLSRTRTRLF